MSRETSRKTIDLRALSPFGIEVTESKITEINDREIVALKHALANHGFAVFRSSDSIKITTRFVNRLEIGTVLLPRIQYRPPQGEPVEVELDKNTAPSRIDTFNLSLKQPQGGWRSGNYRFILVVSNSSGSATIEKPFSVQ